MENKREIIEGLNKHFQKLYFGKKADGTVVDVQVPPQSLFISSSGAYKLTGYDLH